MFDICNAPDIHSPSAVSAVLYISIQSQFNLTSWWSVWSVTYWLNSNFPCLGCEQVLKYIFSLYCTTGSWNKHCTQKSSCWVDKLKKTHSLNKNTVHLFSLSAPQDPKMGKSIKECGLQFRNVSNLVGLLQT